MKKNNNAKFITLEGIDGAGKSTHLAWLENYLRARGIEVILTREPGGTPLGESLRNILLHQPMNLETEALLMFAARCEHLHQVILPALKKGVWVISDRFTDATYAYQGGGRGLSESKIAQLEKWVQQDLQPDLTLLFDVPSSLGKERVAVHENDRFEREQQDFFERVRQAYIARAKQYPQRFKIIDSSKPLNEVQAKLQEIISQL
jgi:dTMP kinase